MTASDSRPSPAPMDVLKQFRSIFNTVKQHFQQVEAACRVSGAQLWALAVIVRQPGLRVSELAKAMAVHQSTTSNLVERLVELKM
ncbi:MAG: MarR family transcriptional regulator, partial [Azovibrio sp.]|nr:MarR family transcriptional regulator [Azovibrio sp.]